MALTRESDLSSSTSLTMSRLAGLIDEMDLRDALSPLTQSPLLQKATVSGLHVSCPIPLGIIKAIEVEADLAVPTDVGIHFE